ncbi:hypothetical protein FACS1894140_3680 [Spirochaetia bacterium]|nr:hypothetical protein FACS1894140_3680 [Spirochaetia bacterium]
MKKNVKQGTKTGGNKKADATVTEPLSSAQGLPVSTAILSAPKVLPQMVLP